MTPPEAPVTPPLAPFLSLSLHPSVFPYLGRFPENGSEKEDRAGANRDVRGRATTPAPVLHFLFFLNRLWHQRSLRRVCVGSVRRHADVHGAQHVLSM